MNAVTDTTVALAWTASTDNVGVTGYRIRRITDGTATPIGTAPANVTAFTVSGLTASTSYTFDIQALDAAGTVSQPSARVIVTTNGSARINLALYRPTRASSSTQSYGPGNAVDGSPHTYWESANNAFPQWLDVDLGAATGARDIVLTLPLSPPGPLAPRPSPSRAAPTARPIPPCSAPPRTSSTPPPGTPPP